MKARFANWLFNWLFARVVVWRKPDFTIGDVADPYMHRWWLVPRNRVLNVYLHCFIKSDDDRALHDHPWVSLSYMLFGSYAEHTIVNSTHSRKRYRVGSLLFRRAKFAHRIEILPGDTCWTLFITGPSIRQWGFHCPQGWKHWKEFTAADNPGAIGKGCEQ